MVRQRETAVLVASDLHFGRETQTYNPAVFRKRMDQLGDKMAGIRSLLSEYDFDGLTVCLLGDVNDGSGIYPGQTNYQAIPDPQAQAFELADYLGGWCRRQKEVWGNVTVEAVPGNHGRTGKHMHEAANWDLVAYNYLALKLGDDVAVNLNREGDPFLRKIRIRKFNYVLYHGHDVRSFAGIPWYGILLRLSRWLSTQLAPFDVAMLGHFHSFGLWQINRLQMLATGTMVSDDPWALRTLGWESATRWHLFGVGEKRPITWQFGLDLTQGF